MLRKLISVMLFALPITSWSWGPGFYVGGGFGADAVDFNQKAYIDQPPNFQKFSVFNNTEDAAQGIFGTLFGGYSFIRQAFHFGVEGNINASTAEFNTTNREFDHSTKQVANSRYRIIPNWGVSVLPGWFMFQDSALIFARVGYAGGVFNIKTSDTSLENVNDVLSGFRYGLGIEKRVYKNVGLRFEYNHIIYESSTVYHVDTSNGALTVKQTVVIPETNQFEFSLVYRFC